MRFIALFCGLFAAFSAYGQVTFDEALNDLSKKLALGITPLGKDHIAVSDLVTLSGDSTALGVMAAEEMTIGLVKYALGFEVMDRAHLKAIFDEHKLAMGGLLSEEGLIELGKLESVDVVVTGTITPLPDRYKITIKALDTETAGVIAAERAYCKREPWLDAMYTGEKPPSLPIKPIDPTPIKPTLPCHVAGTGAVSFENHTGQDLILELSCESSSKDCSGSKRVRIPTGGMKRIEGLCAGIIHYELLRLNEAPLGKGGTLYVKTCDVKSLVLTL